MPHSGISAPKRFTPSAVIRRWAYQERRKKRKYKYNKISGRQNGYVKTGTAKKARQKRVSRAPAFHVNNLLNIGRPKGTFPRKQEGGPSIQALFCEFCRTLSRKALGIKPTKRPTERTFPFAFGDTAPLLRRTVSRSAKRVAVAGRAELRQSRVTASHAKQAGGLRPSGLTSKPCAASRAKKAGGLPPSKRNCADSAHRLKYGGARRGPRFRRKTGTRKLPRGCEKQRTRTKQRAGTVD